MEDLKKIQEFFSKPLEEMMSLDDQAKAYYLAKVKSGEIDTLPEDPKAAFLAQMTKDQIAHDKETLRRERGLEEVTKSQMLKKAKKGSYPATLVAIENGKVVAQEKVSTPQEAPAAHSVMSKKYPNANIRLEDSTGKILEENIFKVGQKVTYLGHPAVVTATKEYNGRNFVSVSYDKGTGATKASMILATSGDVKPLNEISKEDAWKKFQKEKSVTDKTIKVARKDFEKEWEAGNLKENSRLRKQFILLEPAEIKYTESYGTGIKAPGVLHQANEGVFLGAEDAYIIVLPGGTFYVDEDAEIAMPIWPLKDQPQALHKELHPAPFAPEFKVWKDWIKRPNVLDEATKEEENEFHKKLDKLVHKTFGHSSDEKKYKKGDKLKIKLKNGKEFDVIFDKYLAQDGMAFGKIKNEDGEFDTKPFALDTVVEYNTGIYYHPDKEKYAVKTKQASKSGLEKVRDFVKKVMKEEEITVDDATEFKVQLKHLLDKHVVKNEELSDYEEKEVNYDELYSDYKYKVNEAKPKKGHGEKISKEVFSKLKGKTINYKGSDYKVIDSDEAVLTLKDEDGKSKTINLRQFNVSGMIDEIMETIELGKNLNEELCPKGKAYIKKRQAAGEKSSAYLSGRAVKVCKGQMKG